MYETLSTRHTKADQNPGQSQSNIHIMIPYDNNRDQSYNDGLEEYSYCPPSPTPILISVFIICWYQ